MMKQFEYKMVTACMKEVMKMTLDFAATEAILTGLGLEGWELVNAYTHTQATNGMPEHIYILKREIVKDEDIV